jgi:hypothetical protein
LRIAIDAPEANLNTIVHEAAHVIDFEQLLQSQVDVMASKYGADDWYEGEEYFSQPAEMFADSRARCLGYGSDGSYEEMACEDIDRLIAGTAEADKIIELANSAS